MTQSHHKLAVVAVGGNALITDEDHRSAHDQYRAAQEVTRHIVDMLKMGWRVVLTHGNGPQVGFFLRRSELALREVPPQPLDYSGASTQGEIGYMFQRAVRNEINLRIAEGTWTQKPITPITVVTQTLVDAHDPAFQNPTKPIGSFMDELTAKAHAASDGWCVIEDSGRGWRRVVPSPLPQSIVESDAINALAHQGFFVICNGGGGVPVVRADDGQLCGVEAVIDKDLVAALLASELRANLLLISTGVEKVAVNFGKPTQRWLDRVTTDELRRYYDEGHFPAGSMGPKILAIMNFLRGRHEAQAVITDPVHIGAAMEGKTGTWISSV